MKALPLLLLLAGCASAPFTPVGSCPSEYVGAVLLEEPRDCANIEKKLWLARQVLAPLVSKESFVNTFAGVTILVHASDVVDNGKTGRYDPETRSLLLGRTMVSTVHELTHDLHIQAGSSEEAEARHETFGVLERDVDATFKWNVVLYPY